jgi:hypothetical protein
VGPADAAFRTGLAGLATADGRNDGAEEGRRASTGWAAAGAPAAAAPVTSITRLLFPDRLPDLPDAVPVNGEPMDLAYVVGVLLGNRDLERRLAAENGGTDTRLAAAA